MDKLIKGFIIGHIAAGFEMRIHRRAGQVNIHIAVMLVLRSLWRSYLPMESLVRVSILATLKFCLDILLTSFLFRMVFLSPDGEDMLRLAALPLLCTFSKVRNPL